MKFISNALARLTVDEFCSDVKAHHDRTLKSSSNFATEKTSWILRC